MTGMHQQITFVDLFSGIGGLRLGFEQAAIALGLKPECQLSSEIDLEAQKVYALNFQDQPKGDIRQLDSLPDHEILLAGFPCQSFSYAGKKEGFGDTRGTLFFEIVRLLDSHKPKAFIFENVRGLVSHDQGRTLATIRHQMVERGYSFDVFMLNSCNFGVPQNRVRVYMVGLLEQQPTYSLTSDLGPKDSHSYLDPESDQLDLFRLSNNHGIKKLIRVADILEDDPPAHYDCSLEFIESLKPIVNQNWGKLNGVRLIDYRGGNSIHSWQLGLRGNCTPQEIELMNTFILKRRNKIFGRDRDGKLLTREQIATFFPADNLEEILSNLVQKNYLKLIDGKYKPVAGNFSFEIYKFLDPDKISVTLVASDANRLGVVHRGRVRRITPREAARLQGFPDHFLLHPNDDRAYYQLGNSVTVPVVCAVAKQVLQLL